jgi:uncharacterized protein
MQSVFVKFGCALLVLFVTIASAIAQIPKDIVDSAESGNAESMRIVGFRYLLGHEVEKNNVEASLWLEKAASKGDITSMWALGAMYYDGPEAVLDGYDGEGIEKSNTVSMRWYQMAAESGNSISQNAMGNFFYRPEIGVQQDYQKALYWYRLAADAGNMAGQYNLAYMYDTGRGTDEDNVEAARLYMLSAEQGMARAQFNLAVLYEEGEGIPRDQDKAIYWFRAAAVQGRENAVNHLLDEHIEDYLSLADDLYLGSEVKEDPDRAISMLRYAISKDRSEALPGYLRMVLDQAENGNPAYQYVAADIYFSGNLVKQDLKLAQQWLVRSSDNGYMAATSLLGYKYLNGEDVGVDYDKALQYFETAAEHGNALAFFGLAQMYSIGLGVDESRVNSAYYAGKSVEALENPGYDESLELLYDQAEKDSAPHQYILASLLLEGEFIEQDIELAVALYSRSAEQGFEPAVEIVKYYTESSSGADQ